jgi:hypothetical protein
MASTNYDSIILNGDRLQTAHTVPKYAGHVKINHFSIISPNNFPGGIVDLTHMFTRCEITENIFSPYVSGYIDIGDAIGLFERIPIIGEEVLHISFQSVGADIPEDKIDRYFRVVKVTNFNIDPKNDRLVSYTLNFTSIEYVIDLATKVQKCYAGMKISDMVENIYEDYINPHTSGAGVPMEIPERLLDVETTKAEHNFTIPNITPFQAMLFLASRAEASGSTPEAFANGGPPTQQGIKSNGAFYCFYDTVRGGFKFKSLESLMQGNEKIRYVSGPAGLSYKNVYDEVAIESHKILEYHRISPIAVDKNLKNGMYGNRLITHNIIRMRHDYHDLYYKKGYSDAGNIRTDTETGALIQVLPPTTANDFGNAVENNSKHQHQTYVIDDDTFHLSDAPVISRGSDVIGKPQANVSLKSTNEGCYVRFTDINSEGAPQDSRLRETHIENWYAKRKMQNQLLNNFIYHITVPGNTHREVGDVINLQLPTKLGERTGDITMRQSTLVSGKFVVTRLSHIFQKTQSRIEHSLSLHVMKDGLSRKLPGTDYVPSNFGTWEGKDTDEALAVSGRKPGQSGR